MKIVHKINGKVVTQEEFDKKTLPRLRRVGAPLHLTTYSDSKPLVSEGLGVMPHQVEEARQRFAAAGLTAVRVRNDGAVEITSRGDRGRRGLLKLRGFHDNDGGYGDG